MNNFYLPLMSDNIERKDVDSVIEFLNQNPIPKLTNGPNVVEFENAWGEWLGTKYNLMVNSGASANYISVAMVKELKGIGGFVKITLPEILHPAASTKV